LAVNKKMCFVGAMLILVFLSACGPVERFKRWEDTQEKAARTPGTVHFADDLIDVTFARVDKRQINLHLQNKTHGRITIRWEEVSFRFPSGDILSVMHGGDGSASVIPALSEISDSISPVGRIPYLADEDKREDQDGSFDFQQEFGVSLLLDIEVIGGKKTYNFNFGQF
jgi:hypothetical protein